MSASVRRSASQLPITSASRRKRRPPQARNIWLAIFAGVLMWLANPPVSFWPAAWFALIPLIFSIEGATRFRQAFWRGYLFAWVFLGSTWYWTGLTIVAWTHSDVGWFAWFGLTLVAALFYGFWAGVAWSLHRRTAGWWKLVAPAAAWAVMEYVRTLSSLSMPWAQVSYTQYHFLPILQIADITGAYGVSFLIILCNFALAYWLRNRADVEARRRVKVCYTAAVVVALYGCLRLLPAENGRDLPIAVMQDNFRVDSLDAPDQQLRAIEMLTAKVSDEARSRSLHPELFVWAESAAPRDAINYYPTFDTLERLANSYKAPVLVGGRVVSRNSDDETNSAIMYLPDGARPVRYDKQQLVPFGEFIPFRNQLPPFLDETFGFPKGDVTPGTESKTMRFRDSHHSPVIVGPFICYESIYPDLARAMARLGANLLVTQSNDDWFQSDAAMEQHLSAVALRAIENRREVIRSTTTGITCLVDTRGRIVARAPLRTEAYLLTTAHLYSDRTVYTVCGDWFILLCFGMIVYAVRRPSEERNGP